MHRTGLPEGLGTHTCGECTWFRSPGCALAVAYGEPPAPTDAATPACAHFETPPDCRACGACCREAFDAVPVLPTDTDALTHHADWVVKWSDEFWHLARKPQACGTRCVALTGDGSTEKPYTCVMYEHRMEACRTLESGSDNCLMARRRVGLAYDP